MSESEQIAKPIISKEKIVNELKRCGKDPIYFLKTYGKIAHPEKGTIPFHLYPFQQKCILDFKEHRYNVVLKARQIGLSWTVAGYIAWLINFHKDKSVLCVATKEKTAANVIRKVKKILKSLPSWMLLSKIVSDNQSGLELSNGSWARAAATSSDVGVSESLSLLVVDEAALVLGMDELWTGLAPTLTVGGSCIAISTPRGVSNWFYNTYQGAEKGENNFHSIKIMWDEHPDRDIAWFNNETKNLNKRQIAQEYCCNFNSSGDTFLESETIEILQNGINNPIRKDNFDRFLWIWEEPIPGEFYIISADTSTGDAEDNTGIQILKASNCEQVAEYRGKIKDNAISQLLYTIALRYNNAIISIEMKATGPSVLNTLVEEYGYKNLYCMTKQEYEYVDFHLAESTASAAKGFLMTPKNRPLILAKMEEMFRVGKVLINSSRLLEEFKVFMNVGDKPKAAKGQRDDLVLAYAMAIWVRDSAIIKGVRHANMNKLLLATSAINQIQLDSRVAGQIGYRPNISAIKREMKEVHWSAMAFKG